MTKLTVLMYHKIAKNHTDFLNLFNTLASMPLFLNVRPLIASTKSSLAIILLTLASIAAILLTLAYPL